MPIYEAQCQKCGSTTEYYQTAANCRVTPICCDQSMQKVILTAPFGVVDIPAYVSPTSCKWINSRKERMEDMKRSNSRPWEGMEQEKKEAARQKAYKEEADDKKLDAVIADTLSNMKPEQKQVLGVV